jgi:hypothetical protein
MTKEGSFSIKGEFGYCMARRGFPLEGGAMSVATDQAQQLPTPRNQVERLELARELFQKFYAQCFWHSPRDLEITEDLIPFVVKGLRANGGHLGFVLAGKLRPNALERESLECR